jgi:hypothetical protein
VKISLLEQDKQKSGHASFEPAALVFTAPDVYSTMLYAGFEPATLVFTT